MTEIIKRAAAIFMVSCICCIWFRAEAQLASTNLDGLHIAVANIYRSGDSRDLDCSIGFNFSGEMTERAIGLSSVKILEAVDDTGKSLIRTNRHSVVDDRLAPARRISGLWQLAHGLKSPAPNAKTIRHLEAEVELYTPTTNTPVLTNFMSKPGKVLHQETLDQYPIKIIYESEANDAPPGSLIIDRNAGKSILLRVDDPQHKLVKMAFQKVDGRMLATPRVGRSVFGSHTDYHFVFPKPPPHDLNLVVYVATPKATDKVRFGLDNIRLPWVDLPNFEASANVVSQQRGRGTNPFVCYLQLNFTGGVLTNAAGIRDLWITNAEDNFGRSIKVGYGYWGHALWRWKFDAMPPPMSNGRSVHKLVPLVFQSFAPKGIRVLKGNVEMIGLNATTAGKVVITNFLSHTNAPFDLPILNTNRVRLAFQGTVSYAAKHQELAASNLVFENSRTLAAEVPATNHNALEFVLDDPDHAVIAPFGDNRLNFRDSQGKKLQVIRIMTSGNRIVYRFLSLPSADTQLVLYLAIPLSLHRVPFQIKDIPLN